MEFTKLHKRAMLALLLLFVFLVMFGLIGYYQSTKINPDTASIFTVESGEAPYTDIYGKPVALDKYLGQPLVVVTWASWSPFSEADIKALGELSQEFNQVAFMAINRKEPKDQAERYINSIGTVPGNVLIVLDPRDEFYTAVGGYAMPEVVVYNKKGEIVLHERGVTNKDKVKEILTTLLSE